MEPVSPKSRLAPPPSSHVIQCVDHLHGRAYADPYRWLEDQEAEETRQWIEAQNAYTDLHMRQAESQYQSVRARLEQLLRVDWVGVPRRVGRRLFYTRQPADREMPVICCRGGVRGREKELVDSNTLSDDLGCSAQILDVSADGNTLAYGIQQGGEDEVEVRFMDVRTGVELPDRLPRARYFGGLAFAPEGGLIYYSMHTDAGPLVYAHVMGTAPTTDPLIYGMGLGAEVITGVLVSECGRWLVLADYHGSSGDRVDITVFDRRASGNPILRITGMQARFDPAVGGSRLYLSTNWNAPNGRVLAIDLEVSQPSLEAAVEVVPESDASIEWMGLWAGRIVVSRLANVQSVASVFTPGGLHEGDLELPCAGTVSGFSGRWGADELFYSFVSFTTPATTYRMAGPGATPEIWFRPSIPLDADGFEVRQEWYQSRDGQSVPMYIVIRKGLRQDGGNPCLLTGYGGFNISLTPAYSSRAVVVAEQGGVYAVPALRGGGEFGEKWHQAGMGANKQNTFDDFAAAAKHLCDRGYTSPERLAIVGGSNGGLLMGATITQQPGLARAVVCAVPLLDMIRFHQFLVARFWVPEYGSSEDPAQAEVLAAYSPYHNVKVGEKYPAVLFVTGDADTRVAPLHARKMAALLQAASGSDLPVLLRYDTKSGHSGGKPMGKQIHDMAEELAFLLWQVS